jgi:hypothetical protein
LLSGFWFWNGASSAVWQREKKARICAFSFALGAFAFFALIIIRTLALSFDIMLASVKAQKKRGLQPLAKSNALI